MADIRTIKIGMQGETFKDDINYNFELLNKEKASNSSLVNDKGIFLTDISLKTTYPTTTNKKGFFAFVGSKNPFRKWEVQTDGGEWLDTGQDIDITGDLADYAKKNQVYTEYVDQDFVCISDEKNNAVAIWRKDGTFDTPQLSTRLINQIKDDAEVSTQYTNQEGVFIADENGHSVASWDKKGVFNTPYLSENLLTQIWDYIETKKNTPQFLADVYLIPCYGQSLSINTSAGPSTFDYIQPLSHDVYLKNTNIEDMCAGLSEMFDIMASRIGYTLPPNFKIMSCLGGAGGKSVSELSKGTEYYNNVINSVKTAKETCDAAGLTLNVPCFTWTQGEEDMRAGGNPSDYGYGDFDPFTYKDRLKKLIDDFNSDIKSITGQVNDILCVSYQVASHTSYKRYPRIALQQAELAREDSRMIVSKTMYDVDYVTEEDFQGHAPAATYRNMGNMYGVSVWNACIIGKPITGVYPIHHSSNGKQILIKFNVPSKPLVLDTNNVNQLPDGNYGFCVYNVDEMLGEAGSIKKADTIIDSVSVQSDDTILITLNRTPLAGERLTYAINGDYWQNIAGEFTVSTGGEGINGITKSGFEYGSRGCLRDSQDIKNDNSGVVFKDLYNWCEIFEIKL